MTRVRALPRRSDSPLVAILKKLGCLYCEPCRAYMYPEHREHLQWFDVNQAVARWTPVTVEFTETLDEVMA